MTKKNGLILMFMLSPVFMFGNAGSPMMWFGIIHLLIINFIIGLFESIYIEKRGISNNIVIVVIANYFSMYLGLYHIAPYFSSLHRNIDFWGGGTRYGEYNLIGFKCGMLASFLATLFLEFPLYYFSLKDKKNY